MTDRPDARPADLLVYDGECGFCSACARFAERWVAAGGYRALPWQALDLESVGLTIAEVTDAAWFLEAVPGGGWRRHCGHLAIARALSHGSALWRPVGVVLGSRPASRPAAAVYRYVARHRDRLPGGTAACAMPPPRSGDPISDR